MMELFINDREAETWAAARLPKVMAWLGTYKSLAAIVGSRILGVVIYDGFTPYDCNLHLVIEDKHCLNRRTLRAVFRYPFEQLGLKRVTAQVPASNLKALDLDQRLGFTLEGRKILGCGDEDELILGMTRGNCRWL